MEEIKVTEEIKKYALIVMPDVCRANGKDPTAAELLEKMKTYGKVVPLKEVIDAATAEYQESIKNLKTQLDAVDELNIDEDEKIVLAFYRQRKKIHCAEHQAEINSLRKCLEEVNAVNEKKAAQINELCAKFLEVAQS